MSRQAFGTKVVATPSNTGTVTVTVADSGNQTAGYLLALRPGGGGGGDTTPPTLAGPITVTGYTVTVPYNEQLHPGFIPLPSQFGYSRTRGGVASRRETPSSL